MTACVCGSARSFEACCGRFLVGQQEPNTACELMRARYAAFVRHDAEFLWKTLHPQHDDRERSKEEVVAELARGFRRQRFGGLVVHDEAGPDAEGVALVLFSVKLRVQRVDRSFVELSRFLHDGVGWRYLVGVPIPASSVRGKRFAIGEEPFL